MSSSIFERLRKKPKEAVKSELSTEAHASVDDAAYKSVYESLEQDETFLAENELLARQLSEYGNAGLDRATLAKEARAEIRIRLDTMVTRFNTEAREREEQHFSHKSRIRWGAGMLAELEQHRFLEHQASTPEGLLSVDLDALQQANHVEVLRERTIHQALISCKTVEDLRFLETQYPSNKWGHKEFFEFSNRYRLFGSATDEIRLFEGSKDSLFQQTPRAREFYALALIKEGRGADAIAVCQGLIKDGLDNGLVHGIMGNAHLRQGEASGSEALRREATANSAAEYRKGFEKNMSSFCALGLNEQTRQMLIDRYRDKAKLIAVPSSAGSPEDAAKQIAELDAEVAFQKKLLTKQEALVALALTMQGGSESSDFWAHAGALQLAVLRAEDPMRIRELGRAALHNADAAFKISAIMARIKEFGHAANELSALDGQDRTAESHAVSLAISILTEGLASFQKNGQALPAAEVQAMKKTAPRDPLAKYLAGTVNFRALTGSLTPTYVPGGIGRAGSRVPDLMMNREDGRAFKVIVTELGLQDEADPRVVKNKIEDFVRARLGVDHLQDLQDPDHEKFDITSDGVIELAGITKEMRKGTHSITNMSASLLAGVGDCRETMYAVGALFATQQNLRVQSLVNRGLEALDKQDLDGFDQLLTGEIAESTRYQLRGEHAAVYVEGIEMKGKYAAKMNEANPLLASGRTYSIEEFRAKAPLTKYEAENALLRVTYADGTQAIIRPRDADTKKRRPHQTEDGTTNSRPLIPDYKKAKSISILNLVEDHTFSLLYDERTGTVENADAFYDNVRHNGPYNFGEGVLDIAASKSEDGLILGGKRTLVSPDGTMIEAPVYRETLRYSKTDYAPSLGEGDLPGNISLMGRTFHVDIIEEIEAIKEGRSLIPKALKRVYDWQKEKTSKT